jgi:hypothetical protein
VNQLWDYYTKHPMWSNVIGGLILAGILTGLGFVGAHWFRAEAPKAVAPIPNAPPVAQAGLPPGSILWPDPVELPADDLKAFEILVESMRAKNHVRRLALEEDNLLIRNAPRGVFVFVHGLYIKTLLERPRAESPHVRVGRSTTLINRAFEVHILDNDLKYLVAFVSRDVSLILHRPDVVGREMSLYGMRWENAKDVVALALDVIELRDSRSILSEIRRFPIPVDINVLDVKIRKP